METCTQRSSYNMEGFKYLASPYSHKNKSIRYKRFIDITTIAAKLFNEGHILFCPITQSHNLADTGMLEGSWEFWERVDLAFLAKSEELYVVTMDGWKESVGVGAEIDFAIKNNIPVKYVDPITLEITEEPLDVIS